MHRKHNVQDAHPTVVWIDDELFGDWWHPRVQEKRELSRDRGIWRRVVEEGAARTKKDNLLVSLINEKSWETRVSDERLLDDPENFFVYDEVGAKLSEAFLDVLDGRPSVFWILDAASDPSKIAWETLPDRSVDLFRWQLMAVSRHIWQNDLFAKHRIAVFSTEPSEVTRNIAEDVFQGLQNEGVGLALKEPGAEFAYYDGGSRLVDRIENVSFFCTSDYQCVRNLEAAIKEP